MTFHSCHQFPNQRRYPLDPDGTDLQLGSYAVPRLHGRDFVLEGKACRERDEPVEDGAGRAVDRFREQCCVRVRIGRGRQRREGEDVG